jgi:serine/threonine protein kinase
MSATRTLIEEQTRKGMIVGTIAYRHHRVYVPGAGFGQRARRPQRHVFLRILLHEMLAGHRPPRAPTSLELLQQVIHGEPTPLSGDIPEPLRALVVKALQKNPADRYSSMRELVAALRAAQRPSGVAAAPEKYRRTWPAATSLVIIAAAAAGAAFYGHGSPPSSPAERTEHAAEVSPGGSSKYFAGRRRDRLQMRLRRSRLAG